MMKLSLFLTMALSLGATAFAQTADRAAAPFSPAAESPAIVHDEESGIEELNPFSPGIEDVLRDFDEVYETETGLPSHLEETLFDGLPLKAGCVRDRCDVWLQIVKSTQTAYLYINGWRQGTFKVSTGAAGHTTPNFDTHPNGRIYDRYTSSRYPEGDYNGLGNMPYAVFISGGFAVHGTPQGNWRRLGTPASHGCIRMHPDNAYRFNRLVRQYGISRVWITVQN